MENPVKISSIHLFIINVIRLLRVNLGLSQKDIQDILDLSSDSNLLGSVESNFRTERYHDKHLNKLAIAFTKIASEQGKDISYTVSDFYPPVNFKEEMIEKIVVKIEPTELKQTGILYLLLEEENDPFFNDWHTSKEIAQYCGGKAGKNWGSKDFTAVIEYAVKKGKLIRKSEDEALFKRP
ncbi:hypothetical protein FAZ19_03795 [Sphingobacterium alkalisoli]|uniref:Uncharacterized protein n=1 Tax=Sphingobacterium alkalisoli TaxID=1874115 RepID=A0A4U0H9C3_9SPHI|nr:hypothetical protein [Sphingobacterium alkalisoli]TJY68388.1 hypothetical protein FAZ19_03795 [Sphingobacterium alkalisoli]GGH06843.1 hypothetical protein GCM10011418_03740 [Sphingobacterium alkalisoli]